MTIPPLHRVLRLYGSLGLLLALLLPAALAQSDVLTPYDIAMGGAGSN